MKTILLFILFALATSVVAIPVDSDVESESEPEAPELESTESEQVEANSESEEASEEVEEEKNVEESDTGYNYKINVLDRVPFCQRPLRTNAPWPQCGVDNCIRKQECRERCPSWCAYLKNTAIPKATRQAKMIADINAAYNKAKAGFEHVPTQQYWNDLLAGKYDNVLDEGGFEYPVDEKKQAATEEYEMRQMESELQDDGEFEDISDDDDLVMMMMSPPANCANKKMATFRNGNVVKNVCELDGKPIQYSDHEIIDQMPLCLRPMWMTGKNAECGPWKCKHWKWCQDRCKQKCDWFKANNGLTANQKWTKSLEMYRKAYDLKLGTLPLNQARLNILKTRVTKDETCMIPKGINSFAPICGTNHECNTDPQCKKTKACKNQCGQLKHVGESKMAPELIKGAEKCYVENWCYRFALPAPKPCGSPARTECKQVAGKAGEPPSMSCEMIPATACSSIWRSFISDADKKDEDADFDPEAEPEFDLSSLSDEDETMPVQE